MILNDRKFSKLISSEQIKDAMERLGESIRKDYKNRNPLFIVILNGAFMFAADLMKELDPHVRITFVKLSSYEALESSGNVKQLIGLNENIFGEDVIIVDSGRTARKIIGELRELGAASISIATLLQKHRKMHNDLPVSYVGFNIDEEFVVGYGLDYKGSGRNLKHIYALDKSA
jgi:hypoxanthine phosphoribosyltransferase